ncbi:MAG TPA: hypothetical protein VNZ53_53055 [Steroidobacteraceae bacterium]|nr:hypothetical protein [Steroidobacteraceae bacterium]
MNEGELATRSIDVNSSYRVPLATAGSLLFALVGTRLQSLQTTPVAGFGSYDCAGYFGTLCGVVTPKWRHVLNATSAERVCGSTDGWERIAELRCTKKAVTQPIEKVNLPALTAYYQMKTGTRPATLSGNR